MNTTTFLELERGSLEGRVVFRICLGALNRNARYPPTVLPTGFTASHPYFRTLEDCQVKVLAYTPRDLAPGLHNAWIQQSMIDHLKGDLCWVGQPVVIDYPRTYPPHLSSHQQTGSISDDASPAPTQATMGSLIDFDMNLDGPDGSGSDMTDEVIYPDESPWIVSHANLRWVIHRITRLLHRNPNRGIMMSVISLQGAYTHSAPHLDMLRRNQPWGSAERQTLTETLRFARQSQEVLVYGRIEPSNCLMAYEWTIDVSVQKARQGQTDLSTDYS